MTRNQIAYWELTENKRSHLANERENQRTHKAQESETNRHNLATESEINRHNLATEDLTQQQIRNNYEISLKQAAETERSNRAREFQNYQNYLENARAARKQEKLEQSRIDLGYYQAGVSYASVREQQRHNMANEDYQLADLGMRTKNNYILANQGQQKIDETIRSNLANEAQRHQDTMLTYAQRTTQASGSISEQERHNVATEEETKRHNIWNDILETIKTADKVGTNVYKQIQGRW